MMKLLIVEDDQQLQQMFIRILSKHGYSAVGVSNGQLALDALGINADAHTASFTTIFTKSLGTSR